MKERLLKVDDGVLLLGVRITFDPLWIAVFWGQRGFIVARAGSGKGEGE